MFSYSSPQHLEESCHILALHLYGKKQTQPGRKMGHVTIMSKEYKDLTQDEVIIWIQEHTDPSVFTEAEELIAAQIDQIANPPILNPKLPWDNS